MYQYISISARISTLQQILTPEFSEGVFREKRLAEAAPAMLEILQKVHRVLFVSRPINPEEMETHRETYELVVKILTELKELK
jgi:hypothetical protein